MAVRVVGSIEKQSHFDHDFSRQLSLLLIRWKWADFRAARAKLGRQLDHCRGKFRESLAFIPSISGRNARASW